MYLYRACNFATNSVILDPLAHRGDLFSVNSFNEREGRKKRFGKVCGSPGTSVLSSALSCSCQVILQAPVKTDLTGGKVGGVGGESKRKRER